MRDFGETTAVLDQDSPTVARATELIEVTGAREHNLRDVDVTVPKRTLTVVTGVSGSGKSSLVFDTIATEAQRQMNETLPAFVRGFLPSFARPAVDTIAHLPAVVTVDQRRLRGGARSTIGTITDIAPILRLLFSRVGKPHIGYADSFSFNMPAGMCPTCQGIGELTDIDMAVFLDPTRSLNQGALLAPPFAVGSRNWQIIALSGRLDPDKPVADYDDAERDTLLYSTSGTVSMTVQGQRFNATYEGAVAKFRRLYVEAEQLGARNRQLLEDYTATGPCAACGGTRLSQRTLSSRIDGHHIADLSALEAKALLALLPRLHVPDAAPVVEALMARLGHLADIGLGYLSLDRRTATLSGGESQRVKIVRHLTSSLNDMLYVFDEPSIGLHARDVHRLTDLLHCLRDKGNTVLVVEHDRDVIAAADQVIDIGPGAGAAGGRVEFAGDVQALSRSGTATGRHMTAPTKLRDDVRKPTGTLPIRGASRHNLRDVDVDIPTGVLTAVTGVAGSGKSTLIDVFCSQHPDAIVVDQTAPGANRRSTTATYTGAADHVRKLFATANGVSPALFSANSDGACPDCKGLGEIQTDLAFLDSVTSTCATCQGRRFTDEVLRYRLNDRTISDVLEMTVAEAGEFFGKQRRITAVLDTIVAVGLDYLRMGQPLTSLSGGECQRIKLASHLRRAASVYVLDEPTTGLHMSDVTHLLDVLDRLVDDHGGTIVVIEHNLDVIAHADWVIDLGPDGGTDGGQVMFQGSPADLRDADTHTATYLRRALT